MSLTTVNGKNFTFSEIARQITLPAETCRQSGMGYPPTARFCHICGGKRQPETPQNEAMPPETSASAAWGGRAYA